MKKYLFLPIILITPFILSGCGEEKLEVSEETEMATSVSLEDGAVFDLTIAPTTKIIQGKAQNMLAYNGSIPGPLLKVKQGSEITLNIKNNLNEPTLLHPHGIRVDNAFDGTDLNQMPIEPGATFLQKLKFPDPGIYWYHSHLREDKQQDLGLYGAILVTPSDPNYWSPVNLEEAIFLDDIFMNGKKIAPYEKTATHTLMGRFGNTMLINGQDQYELSVSQGEMVRFYLTNAANTRVFNVGIEGIPLKLVGGDGGVLEREEKVDQIIISPSERMIVEALFEKPGLYPLVHTTPEKKYTLGVIEVREDTTAISYADSFNKLRENKMLQQEVDTFRDYLEKAPDKKLKIGVEVMGMMTSEGHGQAGGADAPCHTMPHGGQMGDCENSMMNQEPSPIEWEDSMAMMNAMSNKDNVRWQLIDEATGKANEMVEWNFQVGDKVKISIFNDSNSDHPMQHPIHFHGQRFLVLARDGQPNMNKGWKDTVLIKTGERVDLLLEITNPGQWMAHCHIAEHLEDGMMIKFNANK